MTNSSNSITSDIAVIMGNGPSAKLIDFKKLSDGRFATVGMNAAYRYWDKIDFRPTHYICMDDVVLMSHADRVYELVNEGRIKKFFLRDQIKEKYPDLADNQRIIWFDDVHKKDNPFFDTEYITTGSWAIRWMAHEGVASVILIGIDSNYVEVIQGAKRIGDQSDHRLVIDTTPAYNPNYFFNDYQQAGDLYNIPNDPKKIRDGQLVHIEALRETKDDIKKSGNEIKIIDCSPLSGHHNFDKRPLSNTIKDLQLAVVTSFYSAANQDELENNVRIAIKNAQNPFIGKLIIMLEGNRQELEAKISSKLMIIFNELLDANIIEIESVVSRPDYFTIFDVAKNAGWKYYAVINSDIYLPYSTIQSFLNDKLKNNEYALIALTRWNRTPRGLFLQTTSPSPPWKEVNLENLLLQERNYLSYDCYLASTELELPHDLKDISIGEFGCDTAIVSVFRLSGIAVTNPCIKYKIEHEDNKIRNYHNAAGVTQKAKVISSIRNIIVEKYKTAPPILESIEQFETLNGVIANIGRFISVDDSHKKAGIHENWFKIFRLLGSAKWMSAASTFPIRFTRLTINAKQLRENSAELMGKVFKSVQNNEFLEIEVVGDDLNKQHYLNFEKEYMPDFEKVKNLLQHYDWHAVIHLDHASETDQKIFADMMLVLKETLGNFIKKSDFNPLYPDEAVKTISHYIEAENNNSAKKKDHSNERLINLMGLDFRKEFYRFKGVFLAGNVKESSDDYLINPPFQANYIALSFQGIIQPNDQIKATIYFKQFDNSKIFCMLCRDGSLSFESATKQLMIAKGLQKLELEHVFKHHHSGFRIQLGAVDQLIRISDIAARIIIKRGDKQIEITARNVPIDETAMSNDPIKEEPKRTIKSEAAVNSSVELNQPKLGLKIARFFQKFFSNL